jgi:hypothetical protein
MTPRIVRIMVLVHIGISLGGMFIHLKLHPPGNSLYFWWASPVSVFSLIVIPVLYCRPSTAAWGFMFNAGTILIGTVGMFYYSVLTVERPLTLYNVFLESALPGIFIAWIKLPVSLVILRKMRPLQTVQRGRGCVGALE